MTIKRSPTDFNVEERLRPELLQLVAEKEAFALYRLQKEGLATPEAAGRIARLLQVKAGAIAYGGLKDKHARTVQHVTLKLEDAAAAPPQADGPGWRLERMGFVPRAITAADIQRNCFRITLRNLAATESAELDQAMELLTIKPADGAEIKAKQLRIANYFGAQRFGSARHHQGFLAKHLIKGDFENALRLAIATEARKDRMEQKIFKRILSEYWGRWREALPKLRHCPERRAVERLEKSGRDFRAAFCALPYLQQQLSVYAYQSYLWNETARRLIAQACAPLGKILLVEEEYGELLFPAAEAVPAELAGLRVPLLARKTELSGLWKEAAAETLKEEGIEVGELQIPGVRRPFFGEEERSLFFTTEEFELTAPEPDETAKDKRRLKRHIAFSLPPGCYATVLLRALGQ